MVQGAGTGKALTAEEWATGLRVLLSLSSWPQLRDHWRLAAHLQLAGRIEVEVGPVLKAYHVAVGDRHLITIPERLDEWAQGRVLLEEIGHSLLGDTCPVYLPARRIADEARLRLIRRANGRSESAARRFVLAWRLPLELILPYHGSDAALCRASGCTAAEVGERWSHLFPER